MSPSRAITLLMIFCSGFLGDLGWKKIRSNSQFCCCYFREKKNKLFNKISCSKNIAEFLAPMVWRQPYSGFKWSEILMFFKSSENKEAIVKLNKTRLQRDYRGSGYSLPFLGDRGGGGRSRILPHTATCRQPGLHETLEKEEQKPRWINNLDIMGLRLLICCY